MTEGYESVGGCAVPQALAAQLRVLQAESGCRYVSIYRGDDAADLLHQLGKHTQRDIFNATPEQRRAWGVLGNPNPPGQSTHELFSDAVAYAGVSKGHALQSWQCGIDVNDPDVDEWMVWARRHGWAVFRPYASGVEHHHVNFGSPPEQTIVGFDSTDRGKIPSSAQAVLGYNGGSWPTYAGFVQDFPHLAAQGRVVDISVSASVDGTCLDVEPRDAPPAVVPGWLKRQFARGVWRPIIYADRSDMQQVLGHLADAGIALSSVRLWVAHPGGNPHICRGSTCNYGLPESGVDATQHSWPRDLGGWNVDISLMRGDFFGATQQPFPLLPMEEIVSIAVATHTDGRLEVFAEAQPEDKGKCGEVFHIWQAEAAGAWHGDPGVTHFKWESMGTPGR